MTLFLGTEIVIRKTKDNFVRERFSARNRTEIVPNRE